MEYPHFRRLKILLTKTFLFKSIFFAEKFCDLKIYGISL